MTVSIRGAFNTARFVVMVSVTVFIWLLLGMVYFDRFIPPFNRFVLLLMPWKGMNAVPPEAGLERRLTFLQGILDASDRVAHSAFLAMIVSFALFSVYLTVVYQQKQRRSRENRLLLLKNREIARRNEFIRYISATISHEFKNNLGRIKRRIDLLPELPGEARERIDENMDKLFADIEIFKKISDEREAGLVDFAKIAPGQMLADLGRQFGDLADITFQYTITPPAIFASPTLLRTVFENVIDNAVKYKKPEQARAQIVLSCSMDVDGRRRYVSLSIRDRGVGMDEHQADRCFYKGKRTREGWGQGLYFAKYVVGLHAGKIRVGKEYTASGVGTEIIINLPFVEEAMDV